MQNVLTRLGVENEIVDYIPECYCGINMGIPVGRMRREGGGVLWQWFCSFVPVYRVDKKFKRFIKQNLRTTPKAYTKENFNKLDFDVYVWGSDTIWSIWESGGFDDGFWSNYDCMKKARCIAYLPCFADVKFTAEE